MPDNDEFSTIENIFGKPPGWIINWGITLGFIFLMVCFGVANFIRYPDKLHMQGTLIAGQKPIEIGSKVSGNIDSLFVKDKDEVRKGDVLLTLQSTSKHSCINQFLDFYDSFLQVNQIEKYHRIKAPIYLELGELTPEYTSLVQLYHEFQNYLLDVSISVKIAALENEVLQLNRLNHSLNKQVNYYTQEVSLTEKDYKRNYNLEKDGVVATIDKEKAESKLLTDQRNMEAFRASIIGNNVRIQQLKLQIAGHIADRENGINTRIILLNKQFKDLNSKILEWQDKYILKSPISGKIAFKININAKDYIESSKPILSVVPEMSKNKNLIIEGLLPLKSSGTLKVGHIAYIQLDNFPSNKYGIIKGIVNDISLIPNEDNYLVKVELPAGLRTSYKMNIQIQPQLKASVSINTEEYTLLERLFQNIMDVARNKNQ
jgi:multidrug resistance efflux pump